MSPMVSSTVRYVSCSSSCACSSPGGGAPRSPPGGGGVNPRAHAVRAVPPTPAGGARSRGAAPAPQGRRTVAARAGKPLSPPPPAPPPCRAPPTRSRPPHLGGAHRLLCGCHVAVRQGCRLRPALLDGVRDGARVYLPGQADDVPTATRQQCTWPAVGSPRHRPPSLARSLARLAAGRNRNQLPAPPQQHPPAAGAVQRAAPTCPWRTASLRPGCGPPPRRAHPPPPTCPTAPSPPAPPGTPAAAPPAAIGSQHHATGGVPGGHSPRTPASSPAPEAHARAPTFMNDTLTLRVLAPYTGPSTKLGRMVTRSKPSSSASCQASRSASICGAGAGQGRSSPSPGPKGGRGFSQAREGHMPAAPPPPPPHPGRRCPPC